MGQKLIDKFTGGIGGNFVIANAINDAGELSAVPLFPSGHNPRLSQNRGNSLAPEWIRVSAVVEPSPIRQFEDAVDDFCDSAGVVVVETCQLVHAGRAHSPGPREPAHVAHDREKSSRIEVLTRLRTNL